MHLRRTVPFCLFLFVFACALCALAPAQTGSYTIGIVMDGDWERNEAIRATFEREILTLTESEFGVQFSEAFRKTGNWTATSIEQAVDEMLEDDRVDMVIALGLLASLDVCYRGELPKPVLAPFAIDRDVAQLPYSDGSSGVHNLCYLSHPETLRRDLDAFRQIVPFTRVTILANEAMLGIVPRIAANVRAVTSDMGLDSTTVPVGTSAKDALAAIPPDTEVVYVGPLLQFPPGEFETLVEGINSRKLPSFSYLGVSEVRRGIMAGIAPESDFPRIARRTALYVQRILLGEDPKSLPVAFPEGAELTINLETARAVDFSPTYATLTEAVVLNESHGNIDRRLDLTTAIREAVHANLELMARERNVIAGEQDVAEARSNVKPQVDISTLGRVIDKDRAEGSLGSQPEYEWSASASAQQVLYSEPVRANIRIQKYLQHAREQDWETLRLDVALDAATAYLDVLRAKTFEQIQKDNLRLTRENLDTARARQAIGVANPSEVYRWESETANSRRNVLAASAQRRQAETALNRIRNRPQEELFSTDESSLENAPLLTRTGGIDAYLNNPHSFGVFLDFMVQEGLAASPELKQFDSSLAAQERLVLSNRRAFYSPTVALKADLTQHLDEGGVGAGGGLSPTPSLSRILGLGESAPSMASLAAPDGPDDMDWSVGLNLSFPLYAGGSRKAQHIKARETLNQLELERQDVTTKIEQRVRSTLVSAQASYAGIEQSYASARAAQQNYDLVSDSYEQGSVSIIELLDAQTASLVAEQSAANAVYDFLADFMHVERAVGQFGCLSTDAEQEAWYERLETYFASRGVAPRLDERTIVPAWLRSRPRALDVEGGSPE